jgi:hypothetical protein
MLVVSPDDETVNGAPLAVSFSANIVPGTRPV